MSVNAEKIIRDIDTALKAAQQLRMEQVRTNVMTSDDDDEPHYSPSPSTESLARACLVVSSAIRKYAPPGSPHLTQMEAILKQFGASNDYGRQQLIGVLLALRYEYETGALSSIGELIHADLFSDFLEMARYLLEQRYKDPAAVVAAGVFEQHLRQLAQKFGVPLTKPNGDHVKAETINHDLTKAGAYDTGTQKEVTAMLDLRNSAAHAQWDKIDKDQVKVFIDRVAFFLSRYPA